MSETSTKPLAELADLQYGGAFSSKLFNKEGKGLPLIRIRDVQRGFSETYFSGDFDSKYLVSDGDFLIGMDGTFAVGEWRGGQALLNQRVCLIRDVKPELDLRYLVSILPKFLAEIEAKTSFVTVKHLSAKVLGAIEIPVPPIEEQLKIADSYFLQKVIEQKRARQRELLSELELSVFHQMFGNMYHNPRWPTKPIGEISESILGKMLDKRKQNGKYSTYPYLRNANIQWFNIDLSNLESMEFSPNDQKKYSLKRGDVLMCEGGDPGRCAIIKKDLESIYFQKALHRIRLTPELLPEYFVIAFQVLIKEGGIAQSISNATISHLTAEKLKDIKIPLPPINLQKKYINLFN